MLTVAASRAGVAEGFLIRDGRIPVLPSLGYRFGVTIFELPHPLARVLDVGTGTGFVARIAAELGHWVTAIDLSERMLEICSAWGRGVELAVGDAVAPPVSRPAST